MGGDLEVLGGGDGRGPDAEVLRFARSMISADLLEGLNLREVRVMRICGSWEHRLNNFWGPERHFEMDWCWSRGVIASQDVASCGKAVSPGQKTDMAIKTRAEMSTAK